MSATSIFDKYMFWETNAPQVAGDGEYMSEWNISEMPRLGGAISLNLAGLEQYGIPVGLGMSESGQHSWSGGSTEDAATMHTGEQEIEYGDETIYGPEDDPIEDSYTVEEEEETMELAPVVDAMLYDQMLKKVGPHAHRRQKHTKRDSRTHNKKTKKSRHAK